VRAALIVAHDEDAVVAARRAVLLLEGASDAPVRTHGPTDDPEGLLVQLRHDLHPLPARSSYQIIHVVGEPTGSGKLASLVPRLIDIAGDVRHAFPALVVREWFVLETGQRLDPHEEELSAEMHRRLSDCHGVFLTASSSEASVAHDVREQSAFTGDLVTLLAAGALDDFPRGGTWVVGTASVAYRSYDLRRALTAHQLSQLLENRLLAAITAEDTNRTRGRNAAAAMRIAQDGDLSLFLRAPEGGSVLDRLRLPAGALDDVPLRYWVDDLASLHDEWVATELRSAYRQIDRRLADRAEQLERDTAAAILEELRTRASLAQTVEYVHGVDEHLSSLERSLAREGPTSQPEDGGSMIEAQERLRRAIARLPYGAAALLRAAAIVLLVGILGDAFLKPLVGTELGMWVAPLAAATSLLWLWIRYARAREQVLGARDTAVAAIDARLESLTRSYAHAALVRLVRRLRAWIGEPQRGVLAELAASRCVLAAAARDLAVLGERRTPEELVATPYALSLPSADDLTSTSLLERFPPEPPVAEAADRVTSQLFAHDWVVDQARVDVVLQTVTDTTTYDGLWRDLEHLLSDSPATRTTAVVTLSQPTIPIITDTDRRRILSEPLRRVHLRRSDLHYLSQLESAPVEGEGQGMDDLYRQGRHRPAIDPVVRYFEAIDVGITVNAISLDQPEVP
jgi:hypothetical protein